MDMRKQMCLRILEGELSISAACRAYGVTRKTGKKWLGRARENGIEGMREHSRAPKNSPHKTPCEKEEALLLVKEQFPAWGGKKLAVVLSRDYDIALEVRTADRILKRNDLVQPRSKAPEPVSFEREEPNMLLQMDFKGSPKSWPHSLLTVLDDHSRMSMLFEPVKDKTGETVFAALWEMFADTGLPLQMLMDNGDCWGSVSYKRCPTTFEAKLWRLGIKTTHGRPRHPQTQGKVERFHRTALREVGLAMFDANVERSRAACQAFRDRYNWVRPHESLGGRVPGSAYTPATRKRPDKLPEHYIPEGAITRMVQQGGLFYFKGTEYLIGKGLIGQRIELRDEELGMRIYYAGFPLFYTHEL